MPLAGFVNRRQERVLVRRSLSTSRLVTLTGVGGVGKTELAVHVAGQLRRTFPDGAWLVNLAPLSDPDLLIATVADALGLRRGSARPSMEGLVEQLRSRQLLVVLDNCEHLIDACARLVVALLEACPGLRVLATSRTRLRVPGESTFQVVALATPQRDDLAPQELDRYAAVTLFTQRARAALGEFELTAENTSAVSGICRQLEGLPLALELAAGRLRALSPQELLDRLVHSTWLLTGGARTAPERHQALPSSIEWSYQLCTSGEQRLWQEVSVFADGFELDALAAVTGLPAVATPGAASIPGDAAIPGATPDPAGSPGLAGTSGPAGTPHPATTAGLAAAPGPVGTPGLAGTSGPVATTAPATTTGAAEPPPAGELTLIEQVASLVDKSVLIRAQTKPVARYRLLEPIRQFGRAKLDQPSASSLSYLHQDFFGRLVTRAQQEWFGAGQGAWLARLSREHANLRVALQSCCEHPNSCTAGIRLAAELHHYWWARGLLGEGQRWLARLRRAAASAPSAVPAAELVRGLVVEAWLALLQGDHAEAAPLLEQARTLAGTITDARVADRTGIGAWLAQLDGLWHLVAGRAASATEPLDSALSWFRRSGDHTREVETRLLLGLCAIINGEPHAATEHLETTLAITTAHRESWFRGYATALLALTGWSTKDTAQTIRLARQSLRSADQTGSPLHDDPVHKGLCLEALAWSTAQSDPQRAATLLGAADHSWLEAGTSLAVIPQLDTNRRDCERTTRERLGEETYTEHHHAGAALSVRQTHRYARGQQASTPAAEPEQAGAQPAPLTRREQQVARLIANGASNTDIASTLVISPRTAEGHVEHILTKLSFSSRAQIAAWVAQNPAR